MFRRAHRWFPFILVGSLMLAMLGFWSASATQAQGGCDYTLPPRLIVGGQGQVEYIDRRPLNVRETPSLYGRQIGSIPETWIFEVLEGPVCADFIYWWRIHQGNNLEGWIAEGQGAVYFVVPIIVPTPRPTVPVPTATVPPPPPTSAPQVILPADSGLVAWDWAAFTEGYGSDIPDPATITPPPVYNGDLPALPIDTSTVRFVADAGLNSAQVALLAQNGFVVVPAGFEQFDEAYRGGAGWSTLPPDIDAAMAAGIPPEEMDIGHGFFVTTDAMLHSLHYVFENMLINLEERALYPQTRDMAIALYQTLRAQAPSLAGTAMEEPNRAAEIYMAVAVGVLAPEQFARVVDPSIIVEAQPIIDKIMAASEQGAISFLPGYTEDFGSYRPRGHYAGVPSMEAYFRGMNWLSRITFRANDARETQIALLLLRALSTTPAAADNWSTLHDVISFLIGPSDDLGPSDYSPLALVTFGPDLQATTFADAGRLAEFQAQVNTRPGPRINGLILPASITAEDIEDETRGFRLLGQRFTFDSYVLGQLMSPYVGTIENPRLLPSGLDVAAAFGSQSATDLLAAQGMPAYASYDSQLDQMRQTLAGLTPANWMENIYSGWLWSLQPLWSRDAASYPPLMQTEAWLLRDLHAGLGSYTELKHDTVLYTKEASGAGGGGGDIYPLRSFGYVEPNPLVFARIAMVAATINLGMEERGMYAQEMRHLAWYAARYAQIAQKELNGEPLTENDYNFIEGFGDYLSIQLQTLHEGRPGKPDPVALVTSIANDGISQTLNQAVGNVDTIYVVVPDTRGGLQVVRGGVFSYYEFTGPMSARMTDSEWRAQVAAGTTPPRPDWVSAFFSE